MIRRQHPASPSPPHAPVKVQRRAAPDGVGSRGVRLLVERQARETRAGEVADGRQHQIILPPMVAARRHASAGRKATCGGDMGGPRWRWLLWQGQRRADTYSLHWGARTPLLQTTGPLPTAPDVGYAGKQLRHPVGQLHVDVPLRVGVGESAAEQVEQAVRGRVAGRCGRLRRRLHGVQVGLRHGRLLAALHRCCRKAVRGGHRQAEALGVHCLGAHRQVSVNTRPAR